MALSKVRGRPPCPHPRACTDKATMCSYLERDCVPLLMGFLCPSVPPGPRQFAVSLALSRLLPAPSSPAPLRCLPVQRHNWLPGAPEYFNQWGRKGGRGGGGGAHGRNGRDPQTANWDPPTLTALPELCWGGGYTGEGMTRATEHSGLSKATLTGGWANPLAEKRLWVSLLSEPHHSPR